MQAAAETTSVVPFPTTRRRAFTASWKELPDNATAIWRHPAYRIEVPAPTPLPVQTPELAIITALLGALKPADLRKVVASLAERSNAVPDDAQAASAAEYVIRLRSAQRRGSTHN